MRIGFGWDSHEFRSGVPLKIGGVLLPHHQGLAGHSDGDVLLHALTDALLGAVAAGDIGGFFPPSDPQWKGADSAVFVEEALRQVRHAGYTVANVDSTLILAAPKIGPHAKEIQARVASLLGIKPDHVGVKAKTPELWHPDTGVIEDAPSYELTADGRTRLPLTLEPNGSVFVLFRRPGEGKTAVPPSFETKPTLPVNGPWTVTFTPGWGAPAQATFAKLLSWSDHSDPGIRYYSGTARYSTTLDLSAVRDWTLDLGDVREIAEVRLNGHSLGILWKQPFAVKLPSSAVRPGANLLEIDVVNLWPNRLIGDQNSPPEKRFTRTNITKFTATSPLMPSGLLGPVVLR